MWEREKTSNEDEKPRRDGGAKADFNTITTDHWQPRWKSKRTSNNEDQSKASKTWSRQEDLKRRRPEATKTRSQEETAEQKQTLRQLSLTTDSRAENLRGQATVKTNQKPSKTRSHQEDLKRRRPEAAKTKCQEETRSKSRHKDNYHWPLITDTQRLTADSWRHSPATTLPSL